MAELQAVAPPALVDEVLRIIEEGKRRGLVLRAFGGVGFYVHAENRAFFAELGRGPINDLDLVGLSEQRNLARIGEYLETAPLEGSTRQAVEEKLRQLQREIEDAPKTRRWKLRARIGPKKKWYQEVEEGTAAF